MQALIAGEYLAFESILDVTWCIGVFAPRICGSDVKSVWPKLGSDTATVIEISKQVYSPWLGLVVPGLVLHVFFSSISSVCAYRPAGGERVV